MVSSYHESALKRAEARRTKDGPRMRKAPPAKKAKPVELWIKYGDGMPKWWTRAEWFKFGNYRTAEVAEQVAKQQMHKYRWYIAYSIGKPVNG